ncbi:MAG TPA: glycoside hydrolase N-terminal domain-containing protein [Galbitalea sp.]|jgi:alpha-L-fucosidase 2
MSGDTLQLAWARPADDWIEAIPIGNGRIGAMVFGGQPARYQINDATAWSGTPDGPASELARLVAGGAGPARLAEVRAALDAGDLDRAEALLMTFEGRYTQEFLPLLDVLVDIPGAVPAPGQPARVLDLDTAVVEEKLIVGEATLTRRSWVSAPAKALFIELEADVALADLEVTWSTALREIGRASSGGALTIDLELPVDGAPLHVTSVDPPLTYRASDDGTYDPFAAAALAYRSDGTAEVEEGRLRIRGARRLLIALSTSTRADLWWADTGDEWRRASREAIRDRARSNAEGAVSAAADDRLTEHGADVRRVSGARFAIGGRRGGCWDVERDILRSGDLALRATVAAEYGRYLLTAASRAGNPAANLQGIWNDSLRPAWSSNYTININTQMNYWSAGPLGLDDQLEPLIALTERLAQTGADTARELYGARGWVAHHNTDLWGWSLPVGMGVGAPSWAIWMMGGVWLCHTIWDALEFSNDETLLRERVWPLMSGAVEFCLDWLQVDEHGVAYLSPSTSPENMYRDAAGRPRALGLTATSDIALIRSLLLRALRAIDRVDPGSDLRGELETVLASIPAPGIGADGALLEWSAEVQEHERTHRHLSPVIGLYPLDLITPDTTPELADAARRLLDRRGPGAMGWSWAWKIALRARLGDADSAYELLTEALTPYDGDAHRHGPVDGSEWGGLLPNLFSTHPPFQVDGNLGFPAAIAELLLQSHGGVIHLLPALPDAWPDGQVDALRARGGVAVDLRWADGALVDATLTDLTGSARETHVQIGDHYFDIVLPAGGTVVVTDPPHPTITTPTMASSIPQ